MSTYLIAIVMVAVVPLILFSLIIVETLADAKQELNERYLAKAADEVALALDQEIIASVRTLQAMSMASSLRTQDLATYHGVISRILEDQPSWSNILLHDRRINIVLDAKKPYGSSLGTTPEPASIRLVFENAKPSIGKIIRVPRETSVSSAYGFAVRVPVRDAHGKVAFVLSAILSTDAIQDLVQRYSSAPDEFVRAMIDQDGVLAARSRDSEKFVGGHASMSLLELLKDNPESGLQKTHTLEGVPAYTAYRRAPFSGWYSALAVPVDVLTAQAVRTRNVVLSLGLGLLVLSTIATLYFSRWMRRTIAAGAESAADLARGETPRMQGSPIREMEELRTSLNSASTLLRSREKAKGEFLANMSHELRTPLGIVLGMTEQLSKGEVGENEQSKIWEIVKRNGQQLARLIDDILDFSKVEANRLTVESLDFSLSDLLSSVIEDFSSQAREKQVHLKLVLENGCRPLVNSDPVRIRQIIVNLVSNAVKFTERGSIELRLHQDDGDREHVRVTISDTGIGLTPEQQATLFSDFTQGDSSHTSKYGGTGLGLSLSRKIAVKLGGDVKLMESNSGRGSVFEMTIPVRSPESGSSKGLAAQNPSKPTLGIRLTGKVLLAEDSVDNAVLVKSYLKKTGIELQVATNGAEAVELADREKFDLILMDIQMPHVDGYEATTRIRAGGSSVPIIALTAHALPEQKAIALRSGFTDYLTKPLRKEALLDTLARYLS